LEDYFKLLEINPHANLQEIRQAFCKKIRLLHPDTGSYDRQAFEKIMTAYKVLSFKPLRKAYLNRLVREKVKKTLKNHSIAQIPSQRFIFPNRLDVILNRIKVFDKKRYHEIAQEFNEDLIVLLTYQESIHPFEFTMELPIRKRCPLCHGIGQDCSLCEGRGAVGGSAPYIVRIQKPVIINQILEFPVKGKPFLGAHYLIKKLKVRFLLLKKT